MPGSALGDIRPAVMCDPLLRELERLFAGPAAEQPASVFLEAVREDVILAAGQVGLTVVLLPYHAWTMVRAIAVTLFRMTFAKKRLLEWETAAAANVRANGVVGWRLLLSFLRKMAPSPLLAAAVAAAIDALRPEALPVAAPFLILWCLAPLIAFQISTPFRPASLELESKERASLRRTARKTWRYFETFLGPSDHWLPPDNYQERGSRRSLTAPRRPTSVSVCSPLWRPTTSGSSGGPSSRGGSSSC